MENFDRGLQREMLSILISTYPYTPSRSDSGSVIIDNAEPKKFTANIFYLAEHHLINIPKSNAGLDPEVSRWILVARSADVLEGAEPRGGLASFVALMLADFGFAVDAVGD